MSVLQTQSAAVVLLALAFLVVLGALIVLALRRPGPGRTGLVGGGIALALLLPTVTTGWASWRFIRVFSQAAQGGISEAALISVLRDFWSLQRLAWGGVAVLCVLALGLSVLRRGAAAEAPACSRGRAVVIALLPLLALAGIAALSRELCVGLRLAAAVTSAREDNPAAVRASDAALAAEGLPTAPEPGTIAAISGRIASAAIRGAVGSVALAILLFGLGVLGFGLAWGPNPAPALVAVSAALWFMAGLGAALIAAGFFDPQRGLVL